MLEYIIHLNDIPMEELLSQAQHELTFIIRSTDNPSLVHLYKDRAFIGYRFYLDNTIYDVNNDVVTDQEIRSILNQYVMPVNISLSLFPDKNLLISAIERFSYNGKPIRSLEIKNILHLRRIVKKFMERMNKVENSTSPPEIKENRAENSTSLLHIPPEYLRYLEEIPKIKEMLQQVLVLLQLNNSMMKNKSNPFDSKIPLNGVVKDFLLMLFNRIEYHLSTGKTLNKSYKAVIEEMNEPDTPFNELMLGFIANKGRKIPVTIEAVKYYYTKKYEKVGNEIYEKVGNEIYEKRRD